MDQQAPDQNDFAQFWRHQSTPSDDEMDLRAENLPTVERQEVPHYFDGLPGFHQPPDTDFLRSDECQQILRDFLYDNLMPTLKRNESELLKQISDDVIQR